MVMEGGEGVSFGLLSNEEFNRLVQDIIDFFKKNGINVSLQINAGVLNIASGSVTHAFSKATISLANTKPDITFTICMSTDYIKEKFSPQSGSLTQADIKKRKMDSIKTIYVYRNDLYSLVDNVKNYCERLSGMIMPPSEPPPLTRRPAQSGTTAGHQRVSLPPIRNPGRANNTRNGPPDPLDYSASKNQNLTDLLIRIENIIDSMQSGRTDTITLQEIRGLLNALKRQLGIP